MMSYHVLPREGSNCYVVGVALAGFGLTVLYFAFMMLHCALFGPKIKHVIFAVHVAYSVSKYVYR